MSRVSPLSFVMFAGKPAGSACSKMGRSPARAASYMRVAKAITSGESGVGWMVWSLVGFAMLGVIYKLREYDSKFRSGEW